MTIGKFLPTNIFRVINRISSVTDVSHCVILSFNDISSFNNTLSFYDLWSFNSIVILSFNDISSLPLTVSSHFVISRPFVIQPNCLFVIRRRFVISPCNTRVSFDFFSVGVFCSDISYTLFFSKDQKSRIEWDRVITA